MSYISNNNPSQCVGSSMQWPQNNDPCTQILPTFPIVNQPYYDLQTQFLPNNCPITTDTTQQLPPIQFICNQANSGKLISFSTESPEMGPESDSDSSYNSSPDLLANINWADMLQNELKPSNINAKPPKTSQLLANAKPFFPRPQIQNSPDFQQTLDTVSEDQELLSPSSSISMLSTSAYSTVLNPINPSFPMLNLDHFYADLEWLPLPQSMQQSDHFCAQTTPTNDTQQSMVTQVQIPQKKAKKTFTAKFNNHAKGNFYISKEMISAMVAQCIEAFVTRDVNVNDEKLAFGYFKESVAMQINDKQIRVSHTAKGDIIVIHIDLHFANGAVMYLVAMENDFLHKSSVEWKIVQFMSADMIYQTYGITTKELPKSSRATRKFRDGVKTAPVHVPTEAIFNTNFKRLPGKKSKRNQGNHGSGQMMSISEEDLKYYCYESWNNGLMIPVVVVKGKNQWIEWKKFVQVCDRYNMWQWIGISLRYNSSNDEWKIECMDYDAGRIFYQYQLVGIQNIAAQYQISYNELAQYITTSLNIY